MQVKSSKDLLVSSSASKISQTLPALDLDTQPHALKTSQEHFFAYWPCWFKQPLPALYISCVPNDPFRT